MTQPLHVPRNKAEADPRRWVALFILLLASFMNLIDVTIVYPAGVPTFWHFLCGTTPRVILRARQLSIPPEFCVGDYEGDAEFRGVLHRWLADIWVAKDEQIDRLLKARP